MAVDQTRFELPPWQDLRDLVLLTLADERHPVRRYELAERAAAAGRFARELREQRPLSTNPTHPTHLAERVDATIGQMHRDGLLERPRRGYYALSSVGRRRARELGQARAAARKPARATRTPQRTTPTRTAAAGGAPAGPLPTWAVRMPVGRWQPFKPITAPKTKTPAPFTWDADDKDAQTQEHADVLNRLNDVLRAAGVEVICGTGRPACDLAFRTGRGLTIVEAKSLPRGSDEHQMRVGLGQVLQYRAELAEHMKTRIRPILAVPRAPDRPATWRAACEAAGAALVVVGPATRGLHKTLLG